MIIKNIDEWEFIRAFKDMNRLDNFTVQGLSALYNYLNDMNDTYHIDVIALCCEFSEYTLDEYNEDYSSEYSNAYDIDAIACIIDDNSFITYAH